MTREEQKRMAALPSFFAGVDRAQAIRQHPLLRERVIGSVEALPFTAESFDLVTANMVVEHIRDPSCFLSETHRILRPGGRLLIHTTNHLNYLVFLASLTPDVIKRRIIHMLQGRRAEDVFPTYYRINTPKRIRRLADRSGLIVERLTVTGSSGSFDRLGPIGWIECLIMKLVATLRSGEFDSILIAVLRRPSPVHSGLSEASRPAAT